MNWTLNDLLSPSTFMVVLSFFVSYKGKSKIYVVEWFSLDIPQIPIFILEKPFNGIHTMFEVIVWNHFSQCQIVKPEGVLRCRRVDLVSSIECVFGTSATPPPILEPLQEIYPKMQQSPSRKMLHTNNIT